jgi:flagellar L-ring protein FlgH
MTRLAVLIVLALVMAMSLRPESKKRSTPSPLDLYAQEAESRPAATTAGATPGSLWSPQAPLVNLAGDLKASQVDDTVTILVAERASATATGTTQAARKSQTSNSITTLSGIANGRLANLATLGGDTQLQGQGTSSRETTLEARLTARVTKVLPNGNLLIEGTKDSVVNSERQLITVCGIAWPFDISRGNTVRSDRQAQFEVRINGKGVAGDVIRRPNFLYRILLGILFFSSP